MVVVRIQDVCSRVAIEPYIVWQTIEPKVVRNWPKRATWMCLGHDYSKNRRPIFPLFQAGSHSPTCHNYITFALITKFTSLYSTCFRVNWSQFKLSVVFILAASESSAALPVPTLWKYITPPISSSHFAAQAARDSEQLQLHPGKKTWTLPSHWQWHVFQLECAPPRWPVCEFLEPCQFLYHILYDTIDSED